MSKHTIKLNGKTYDAVTGELLAPNTVDVHGNPQTSKQTPNNTSHMQSPKIAIQKPTESSPAPKTANHSSVRIMKSQTLVRHSLKKPNLKSIDTHPDQNITPSNQIQVRTQKHPTANNKTMLTRSESINRFNDFKKSTTNNSHIINEKTSAVPMAPPPISKSSSQPKPASNIFIDAINNADAHNQPKNNNNSKSRNLKLINITSFAVAFIIFAGFFAYQNVPNASLKLASKNSGITAKAPGYIPSGFSMSRQVAYTPGQVTLSFKSNSDNRSFQITQTASSWNSDDLKNSFLASNYENIQQFDSNGKTIYLYDKNNITWVDGGIWYNLESNAELSNSQLISITKNI